MKQYLNDKVAQSNGNAHSIYKSVVSKGAMPHPNQVNHCRKTRTKQPSLTLPLPIPHMMKRMHADDETEDEWTHSAEQWINGSEQWTNSGQTLQRTTNGKQWTNNGQTMNK